MSEPKKKKTSLPANFKFTDLTQRPPRSPRVPLGGYVTLPRLIDKGRAHLAGKAGEYIYNSGLDKRFFSFVKVDASTFLQQIATGKGDAALLAWLQENAGYKPSAWEIAQWSEFSLKRTPSILRAREHYLQEHKRLGPDRADLATNFDFLDLDDYVSFGGNP